MGRTSSVLVVLVMLAGIARADTLADLAGEDVARVRAGVVAVEAAGSGADADEMFVAARASEDKLLDPARAMALYARLAEAHPDARAAVAARKRIEVLAGEVGARGEYGEQARRFAELVAHADERDDTVRVADELTVAPWPGQARVALWTAGWLRRAGQTEEAAERYEAIAGRWPEAAADARLGEVGCALDAKEWSRAEQLAERLPSETAADVRVRADVLRMASRGRWRGRIYGASWVALGLVGLGLLASLITARPKRLRVPDEIVFVGPVVAVLLAVAFTAHRAIAPAVAIIAGGGLVFASVGGLALDALRARGLSTRARAVAHAAGCIVAVAALAYIAVERDGLMDAMLETVRFGPDV